MSLSHRRHDVGGPDEVLASLVALGLLAGLASFVWHNLLTAVIVGLCIATVWGCLAAAYARRHRILDAFARLPAVGWQQWRSVRAARSLSLERSKAEADLRQLFGELPEPLRDDADRKAEAVIRKVRTLPSPEDVRLYAEKHRQQVRSAQRQHTERERREGPDRRSDARQRVRLFFAAHADALTARHDWNAVERYIARAMHNGLPSEKVVAAGQTVIDHFERQMIVDEVYDRYGRQRNQLQALGIDDAFLRRYTRDALGSHRPVAAVRRAADELLARFPQIEGADDSSMSEHDAALWLTAESFVDQQIRAWNVTTPDEERRRWIEQRYEHLKRQQD